MAKPGIRPVVWTPPAAPERARQAYSAPPMPRPALLPVGGAGPEDVVVHPDGNLYTGLADGRVRRLRPDGSEAATIAETGGRPLGIEVAGDGALVVCDAYRGLLRVDPGGGRPETLAHDGIGMCNNAAVAADGSVYFSDSSRRFTLAHWRADLLEHSGTGRLLRWTPDHKEVEVLLDGLQFANGVALAADESFVVVAETGAYRLTRLWLRGARAGQRDTLVDNLPGFPDNVSSGTGGRFWVAIGNPRNRVLDWALPRPPLLRRAVWALPESMQPRPARTAWVMAVDEAGAVVADLQGAGEVYHLVTGVREHGGRLYLGSLIESAVAAVNLP